MLIQKLTALLIWRFNVVPITDQSAYSVVHAVSVGFFGSLVQQVVRHQTRVTLIHDVLRVRGSAKASSHREQN